MKTETLTLAHALAVASQRLRELDRENNRLEALIEMRDKRIISLHRALGDAISTYDPNRKETLVTAERQEAWINELNK